MTYTTPETDVLVVRCEGVICQSGYGKGGIKNMSQSGGDVTDDSDGWE